MFHFKQTALIAACLVAAACATNGKKSEPAPEAPPREQKAERVSVTHEDARLGNVVRYLGENSNASLALMRGLEGAKLGSVSFANKRHTEIVDTLAQANGLAIQECPEYRFIYKPGYEPLLAVTVADKLGPEYTGKRAELAFGAGLELFNVLSWMSRGLDITIIADNAVASASVGEIALDEVALGTGLEAVLKAALIPVFVVESTEEYIFIHGPQNTSGQSQLLNGDDLDSAQREMLERRVTVILPQPPANPSMVEKWTGAHPLGTVLDSLSRQLGVTVVAEQRLHDLPVNPSVMNDVRIGTALDLLIRQWLEPDFGYHVTADRIVIRARTAAAPAPVPEQTKEPEPAPAPEPEPKPEPKPAPKPAPKPQPKKAEPAPAPAPETPPAEPAPAPATPPAEPAPAPVPAPETPPAEPAPAPAPETPPAEPAPAPAPAPETPPAEPAPAPAPAAPVDPFQPPPLSSETGGSTSTPSP